MRISGFEVSRHLRRETVESFDGAQHATLDCRREKTFTGSAKMANMGEAPQGTPESQAAPSQGLLGRPIGWG